MVFEERLDVNRCSLGCLMFCFFSGLRRSRLHRNAIDPLQYQKTPLLIDNKKKEATFIEPRFKVGVEKPID